MSEKEEKILKTFGDVMPNLPEVEKEKLLAYGEGYAAGFRGRVAEQDAKTEARGA